LDDSVRQLFTVTQQEKAENRNQHDSAEHYGKDLLCGFNQTADTFPALLQKGLCAKRLRFIPAIPVFYVNCNIAGIDAFHHRWRFPDEPDQPGPKLRSKSMDDQADHNKECQIGLGNMRSPEVLEK
jgi:hypothetical protein